MTDRNTQLGSSEPSSYDMDLVKELWGCRTVADILARFDELDKMAIKEAKSVQRTHQTLQDQLAQLAPLLLEIQAILSQRGALHKMFTGLELPTWVQWAKQFVESSGIEASWATIKRAMNACQGRSAPALRSEKAVPSNKLQMQNICHAALCALEIEGALRAGCNPEVALAHLRETGTSKAAIKEALKRLGVKEVLEFTTDSEAASSEFGCGLESRRRDTVPDIASFRPGAWSQITNLVDQVMGPALHTVLTLEDPTLQMENLEKIFSHIARAWVPFDSNLGTIELSIKFLPTPKPKLALRAA